MAVRGTTPVFLTIAPDLSDADLAAMIQSLGVTWIVQAGWMHVFSAAFLECFPSRVVNLHPALPGFWMAEGMFSFQQGQWVRGLLLWLTLSRWGLPRLAALVAAILFAVHPLHTEVLNEVVGRSELLVALFLLLALHAAPGRSRRSQGLVIFFFPFFIFYLSFLSVFAKRIRNGLPLI